ncbi:type VI secretion system tube protein TssD [Phocaeicola sp.]
MATRTATINADGIQEREVLFVRYELNQQTDVEGQPTGTTRGGKISVKVKSNDDGNTDILEWMIDTYMSKSGTISFPNRQGGEMKHLSFKEGYVVEYSETYDSTNSLLQYEEFTISAKEIQVGNARHNNRWTIDN